MESNPQIMQNQQVIANPQFSLNPFISVNINQITNDPSNSVLKIKINPNCPSDILVVNSNFTMNYLNLNTQTASLQNVAIYSLKEKERINDVAFFKNNQAPFNKSFISADNGGNILIWDSRAKDFSYKISTHGKGSVLTLDVNDKYFAAGYGREICMWDLKTLKQIGKSSFAHSEPVTCTRFKDNFLLSSGDDYVINIFNLLPGEKDKNLLRKENVELTVNLGQSIATISPLESDYLGAITSVNTFHVVNLASGSSQYQYDAKNQSIGSDYILDMFYSGTNHLAELYCGSFDGKIMSLEFDLSSSNVIPKINSFANLGNSQTFNAIDRFDTNNLITASDNGTIYVLSKVLLNSGNSTISNNKDIEMTG